MNRLIMTVGLPGAGKSTWAKMHSAPIVNPDSIRLAIHGKPFDPEWENHVWHVARLMVKSLFHAGHSTVILDATNVVRARRNEWINPAWSRSFAIFETHPEQCIQRYLEKGRTEMVEVIRRMQSQWEGVLSTEGEFLWQPELISWASLPKE